MLLSHVAFHSAYFSSSFWHCVLSYVFLLFLEKYEPALFTSTVLFAHVDTRKAVPRFRFFLFTFIRRHHESWLKLQLESGICCFSGFPQSVIYHWSSAKDTCLTGCLSDNRGRSGGWLVSHFEITATHIQYVFHLDRKHHNQIKILLILSPQVNFDSTNLLLHFMLLHPPPE